MKICVFSGYNRRRKWRGACRISKRRFLCIFLTAFGVLTLGVLGGEASCSLLILTGVSQSNDFGVLVNDFKVALRISGVTIYVTVFL